MEILKYELNVKIFIYVTIVQVNSPRLIIVKQYFFY